MYHYGFKEYRNQGNRAVACITQSYYSIAKLRTRTRDSPTTPGLILPLDRETGDYSVPTRKEMHGEIPPRCVRFHQRFLAAPVARHSEQPNALKSSQSSGLKRETEVSTGQGLTLNQRVMARNCNEDHLHCYITPLTDNTSNVHLKLLGKPNAPSY